MHRLSRLRPPSAKALHIALNAERQVALGDLKNGILTLLAVWIGYFLVVNFFIRSLDKVMVPYIHMPLGDLLAAQGSVLVFVGALALLIRRRDQG